MRKRARRQAALWAIGILGFSVPLVLASAPAAVASPVPVCGATTCTVTFNLTGTAQTWTVPAGVNVATFDLKGARGGGFDCCPIDFAPGKGGEVNQTRTVTPLDNITVVVGGEAAITSLCSDPHPGGFNGGAAGGSCGNGGGGASDVRIGGNDLAHRVIVAGGGGGSGSQQASPGGAGGNLIGGSGGGAGGGAGGNQDGTSGSGVLGAGSAGVGASGGGGGGYWGGAGGGAPQGGGGGGSSFVDTGLATFSQGVNNSDGVVTITYNIPTDLGVVKTAPATATPASTITYDVTVTNHGPVDANNVTLTEPLPAGTTFVSDVVPAGWTCVGPTPTNVVICQTPLLANGASATFHFTVRIASGAAGPVSNTVTVSAFSPGDPDSSNNSSTATTTVGCAADHTITGTSGAHTLSGGTWCVFNATVSSLTITPGTTVFISNSTVNGGISASSPAAFSLCNSSVQSVNVSGATGFVLVGDSSDDGCGGNSIHGGLTLTNNHGGVEVSDNVITGTVSLTNNSGAGPFLPDDAAPEVENNKIGGSLTCSGNDPGINNGGESNTVTGARTGQCATF
jgi:uncharacterized repeat protein (TIGR01451 family)